ncbi:MAG: hypothetical protein ACKV2Q_02690 [Planctomycetaceae bacterium]
MPRSSDQDKALWNYHDPFPDDSLGPATDHRPAGSRLQRTMPRRSLETHSITDAIRTQPLDPSQPTRPEARLNPKTSNVVQP